MTADEVIFSLGSVYNGKRMVILQKQDGEEKVVFVFTKEDFL